MPLKAKSASGAKSLTILAIDLPDPQHASSALQINLAIDDLGSDLLAFVRGRT